MFKIVEKQDYWSKSKAYTVYAVDRVNSSLTLFLIFTNNGWEWVDSDYYEPYED